MISLKIKLDDLIEALTCSYDAFGDEGWYLDTETGNLWLNYDGVDDLPEDLHSNPRYQLIDPISSHQAFLMMDDFVCSLGNTKAAKDLIDALDRSNPFRRFKSTLLDHPGLDTTWYEFKKKAEARLAAQWCETNDIEPEWI